jgi:hypothetical protein
MRTIILAALAALLAACAGTAEVPQDTQAIRDYVDVGELGEVDRIRTHGTDAWTVLTHHFVIYNGRDGKFLLELKRMCSELTDNTRITPDYRYDHNVMRSRFDTLRGCRIDGMYPLTDAQALELEVLLESAGDGN